MEMQIGDLIGAIRKEGVDAARAEAERIVAEAKAQAAKIVADAEEQAARIAAKSESEVKILKDSAKVTAEHAKRDAVLAFKNAVREEFEKLLTADIDRTLEPETLAKLIRAAMNGEDPALYAAEVGEVTDALKSELADAVRKGLEIRIDPSVKVGFRLAMKDGSGYFDCSDEAIAEMLAPDFADLAI